MTVSSSDLVDTFEQELATLRLGFAMRVPDRIAEEVGQQERLSPAEQGIAAFTALQRRGVRAVLPDVEAALLRLAEWRPPLRRDLTRLVEQAATGLRHHFLY